MKTQHLITVNNYKSDRNMEDRTIDCIVHENDKYFNDIRMELSRALRIPEGLSNCFAHAVCTCSQTNTHKNSSIHLEMYCIYEAPTDVFLLDKLQCNNEDGDGVFERALEFVSVAIIRMRQEQNKSATRFVCILKMALTGEYPLLEECEATLELPSQEDLSSADICLESQDRRDFHDHPEEKGNNDGILQKKLEREIVADFKLKCGFDNESEDSLVKDDNATSTVEGNHCETHSDTDSFCPANDCDNSDYKNADSSFSSDTGMKEQHISLKIEGTQWSNHFEETKGVISDKMSEANVTYDDHDSYDSSKGVDYKGDDGKEESENADSECGERFRHTDKFSSVKLSMETKKDILTLTTKLKLCAFEDNEDTSRECTSEREQCGKSNNTSRKRKWKMKDLKTYNVTLKFLNADSCSMWQIRKGTRSICMKFRPCFVDDVFHWFDRRINIPLKKNELVLRLRCHPECFNSVAMEMKARAMNFKRRRYYFMYYNDPTTDYHDDITSDPQLVQEYKTEDYHNKVFEKSRSKMKRQTLVPEKRPLYKCYNCHAENVNNALGDEMSTQKNSPSRFLECHYHPGYIQRDKKWSCCGRDSCDVLYSSARDQNGRDGCSWGAHSWRKCSPKTEKSLRHHIYQEVSNMSKKKSYYTI